MDLTACSSIKWETEEHGKERGKERKIKARDIKKEFQEASRYLRTDKYEPADDASMAQSR